MVDGIVNLNVSNAVCVSIMDRLSVNTWKRPLLVLLSEPGRPRSRFGTARGYILGKEIESGVRLIPRKGYVPYDGSSLCILVSLML